MVSGPKTVGYISAWATSRGIVIVLWAGRKTKVHEMSYRGLASATGRVSHGGLLIISLNKVPYPNTLTDSTIVSSSAKRGRR